MLDIQHKFDKRLAMETTALKEASMRRLLVIFRVVTLQLPRLYLLTIYWILNNLVSSTIRQ